MKRIRLSEFRQLLGNWRHQCNAAGGQTFRVNDVETANHTALLRSSLWMGLKGMQRYQSILPRSVWAFRSRSICIIDGGCKPLESCVTASTPWGQYCVVSRGRESTSALGGCAGKLEVSRWTTNSSELPH